MELPASIAAQYKRLAKRHNRPVVLVKHAMMAVPSMMGGQLPTDLKLARAQAIEMLDAGFEAAWIVQETTVTEVTR